MAAQEYNIQPSILSPLVAETLRSGTIASLVVLPLGILFRFMGLRIGHYGPKFAALFVHDPQPWQLFLQHMLIGLVSTLPLLVVLLYWGATRWWAMLGAAYGAGFYVVVNSLALPIYFGDPTPWQLGWSTIYPSLVGHVAFGMAIAFTSRSFVARHGRSAAQP
jgi:uncharacterized membrane protein YagU involved in acid resistance